MYCGEIPDYWLVIQENQFGGSTTKVWKGSKIGVKPKQKKYYLITVAAVKMNEILKELFIGDNKFMPTDGVQLGNLLKYNHKLELLDLRNNHLQVWPSFQIFYNVLSVYSKLRICIIYVLEIYL